MKALEEKIYQGLPEKLQKELGLGNLFEAPRLEKVVVNMGIGKFISQGDKQYRDTVLKEATRLLMLITGQKPQLRPARKSIAGFKLREGDIVGLRVTLRGKRMFDFVQRLIKLVIPRVRDFRGISQKNLDANGILSIGIREHIVFPELSHEEFQRIYGLEVILVPNTRNREHAFALFTALGVPFKKKS